MVVFIAEAAGSSVVTNAVYNAAVVETRDAADDTRTDIVVVNVARYPVYPVVV